MIRLLFAVHNLLAMRHPDLMLNYDHYCRVFVLMNGFCRAPRRRIYIYLGDFDSPCLKPATLVPLRDLA